MIDFVGPERVQVRPQGLQGRLRARRVESVDGVDLFAVVLVDEGLDGLDGADTRTPPVARSTPAAHRSVAGDDRGAGRAQGCVACTGLPRATSSSMRAMTSAPLAE